MRPVEVVVVEDNAADVYLIKLALEEAKIHFNLTVLKNGQEAIEHLCRSSQVPENAIVPDVILLDVNVPRTSGLEVLKRLKQTPHLANVPVAVMSSSIAESDQRASYLHGAAIYIEKSSSLEEYLLGIADTVQKLIGRRASDQQASGAS